MVFLSLESAVLDNVPLILLELYYQAASILPQFSVDWMKSELLRSPDKSAIQSRNRGS